MAAWRVYVHSHVGLYPAQWPSPCYRREVLAKGRRVQRITQGEQRGQALECRVVEAIEVGEIARLVDLVDVRLLGGEVDVLADFVADIAQQRVVDELLDDGVLVAARSVREGWGGC